MLAPGLRLGERYTLVRRLGVGGFGAVWRADDAVTGEAVAVKVLHPALAQANGVSLARFRREAEVLARLDHPSIARWRDHAIDAARAFLVVELVDGLPLDRVLHGASQRGAPLELGEVRAIFTALAGAIAYAHEVGVVHRDLKPANVMITRGPGGLGVKVLDFGIARVAGEAQDRTTVGRVLGSYLYMAPEQLRGERPDARADVFALGAILFELLTARRAWARDAQDRPLPFHASVGRRAPNDLPSLARRIQQGPRPRPSDVVEGLPLELDDVVERALAVLREARPRSAGALADVVSRIIAAEAPRGGRTGLTVVALEAEVRAALLAAVPLSDAAPAPIEALPNAASAGRVEAGAALAARPLAEPPASLTPIAELASPLRAEVGARAATRTPRFVVVMLVGLALAAGAMFVVIATLRGPAPRAVRGVDTVAAHVDEAPRAMAIDDDAPRALAATSTSPPARAPGAAVVEERAAPPVASPRVASPSVASPSAGATRVSPASSVSPRARLAPSARPSARSAADAPSALPTAPASPLAALERTLARLRANGAEPAELTALADAIRAEAVRAPSSAARTRVLRQIEQGLAAGDLDRLAEALAALRRLEAP